MDPNDDEAPKDPGSTRQYTEKDYEGELISHFPFRTKSLPFLCPGHRAHTVFVGLHIPGSGKRHSHRRHRHHQKNGVDGASSYEQNDFNLRPSKCPVNNPVSLECNLMSLN